MHEGNGITAVVDASVDHSPSLPSGWKGARNSRSRGWALLLLWVIVLGWAYVSGEHSSTLPELRADVADGTHVVQASDELRPGSHGFAVVEVRWRSGLLTYRTDIVEASSPNAGRGAAEREGVTGRIGTDLETYLEKHTGGVTVETASRTSGLNMDLLDVRVGGWAVAGILVLFLATLGLLITGPEPWRATRWAWCWLLLTPAAPIVALLFLVIGGPTGLSAEPSPAARRLTGGWAFLLACGIGASLRQAH